MVSQDSKHIFKKSWIEAGSNWGVMNGLILLPALCWYVKPRCCFQGQTDLTQSCLERWYLAKYMKNSCLLIFDPHFSFLKIPPPPKKKNTEKTQQQYFKLFFFTSLKNPFYSFFSFGQARPQTILKKRPGQIITRQNRSFITHYWHDWDNYQIFKIISLADREFNNLADT